MRPPAHTAATRAWIVACISGALSLAFGAQDGEPAGEAFFRERVLPLLEAHCFDCHGGGERLRGGLRLTSRAGLLAGGDQGPALDLEDPGASLLLAMVSYSDLDHEMPPSGKLAGEDLETLARWVELGAPWPQGEGEGDLEDADEGPEVEPWAWGPLVRPQVPEVAAVQRVANPIDAFLLARLEAAGLGLAAPAERVALLRRVTYDLTGLPPTPEEVRAFLADEGEGAYERVVERLLASPHHGEKWGRHWLDLVRYAETNGFERDSDKPFMWRYRDWVIDAFNADMPYDRFLLEQLAGDELDEPTPASITATGYHRLMQWDDEPGAGALQGRYDVLDDLVSTTGQVMLGMTLGCARCHDHKKDPIPQADYYRFMSFFHGLTDMSYDGFLADVASAEERAQRARRTAEREARIAELAAELRAMQRRVVEQSFGDAGTTALRGVSYRAYEGSWDALPGFDSLQPSVTGEVPSNLFDLGAVPAGHAFGVRFEGRLVVPARDHHRFVLACQGGARLTVGGRVVIDHDGTHGLGEEVDGWMPLPAGEVPIRLDYFVKEGAPRLRLHVAPDRPPWRHTRDDPGEGWAAPAFDDAGWDVGPGGFGVPGVPQSFVATEWGSPSIWLRRAFDWGAEAQELVFAAHHDEGVEVFVNGVPAFEADGYRTDYGLFEPSAAARASLRPRGNVLAVHCSNASGGQYVDVAPVRRARLADSELAGAAFGVRQLAPLEPERERARLARLVQDFGPGVLSEAQLARHRSALEEREGLARAGEERTRAPAAQEQGPEPAQLHVHVRGNANVLGDPVEPAFPGALDPPAPAIAPHGSSSGRRRALAEWIASPDNPMTARVMANRLWQHHFGRGLVPTSNDFGALGEGCTHPELLDWLAAELIARGWSLKSMHRLIVTSSAYRMASSDDARAREVDPANRLWWRFEPRRLAAEELRDSMLALTGRLNPKVGGPSFFSRMPAEALATSSRPDAAWGTSPEEETFRRSVYIKVKRSLATPILASFDMADTDASCAVRFTTTQPTQALTMLDGEFTQEMAGHFARRLEREARDLESRVRRGLELALARAPGEEEVARNVAFVRELMDEFGDDEARALELFCLLCLNLNEFAYLD